MGPYLTEALANSRHRVIGFSPSAAALAPLKERFYCEFSAGNVDLWRVDLGDDKEVRFVCFQSFESFNVCSCMQHVICIEKTTNACQLVTCTQLQKTITIILSLHISNRPFCEQSIRKWTRVITRFAI